MLDVYGFVFVQVMNEVISCDEWDVVYSNHFSYLKAISVNLLVWLFITYVCPAQTLKKVSFVSLCYHGRSYKRIVYSSL